MIFSVPLRAFRSPKRLSVTVVQVNAEGRWHRSKRQIISIRIPLQEERNSNLLLLVCIHFNLYQHGNLIFVY